MNTAPPTAAPPAASPALPVWAAVATAVALVAALFGTSFVNLVGLWDSDPNYSHGYLVGPISLVLAYRISRRVGAPVRGELFLGLVSILFGVLCQLAVGVVRWPPVSYLGLIAVIRGLLVCAGGRKWASEFNFPLLFLFFMFPIPVTWTGYAALWLQDIVSRLSETLLSLFVVCHRVGHTIRIAGVDQSLVVAEECSGLGQIVSFLAFAALLGHLLARPTWYRVALLVAAVPVAVAANTLRVVLMNLGAVWFGTGWMNGVLHDAPALFSIPVGIVLFLLLDAALSSLAEGSKPPAEGVAEPPAAPPSSPGPAVARNLGLACALLGVGLGAQFVLADHLRKSGELSYPELTGPLESLPQTIPEPTAGQPAWVGQDMTEARDQLRAKLPFADDMLMRAYRGANGAWARLYMVHSRVGEDRKHHPEICIRDVSGAPEDLGFRGQVPLKFKADGSPEDGSPEAKRFRFQTGSGKVVVYYWHYTLAPAPDSGQTALQTLHQRVGVAAPSVTAQVSTSFDDPQTLAAIEKQLLPALHAAALEKVFPPGTVTDCTRTPIGLERK